MRKKLPDVYGGAPMVVWLNNTLPEETLTKLDITARKQAVDDGICWLEDVAVRSAGDQGPTTLEVLRGLRGE
ncbi:MAG: hypothetical protein U1E29_09790 [Coriobacteriia bacterium]|nr:hypothetical protein [Coriobacteriia bacterium]